MGLPFSGCVSGTLCDGADMQGKPPMERSSTALPFTGPLCPQQRSQGNGLKTSEQKTK